MEYGFVEQRAALVAKRKNSAGMSLLIMGILVLILGYFFYSSMASDPDLAKNATMSGGFMAVMGFLFALGGIFVMLKSAKLRKQILSLNNLTVLSEYINKKEAAKTINTEIAEGKVQIEVLPFGKYMSDVKYILLPTYLVLCYTTIVAVPIEKVYWICTERVETSTFINNRMVSIKGYVTSIFYDTTTAYISAKNRTLADEMTAKFHKYIPDVLGEYDSNLEKLFKKSHSEFLTMYNERKEKSGN